MKQKAIIDTSNSATAPTAVRADRRYNLVGLLVALVAFWLPVIVFAKLAGEVLEREPIAADVSILSAIHHHATPLHDRVVIFITNCGSAEVIAPLTVLLAGLLFWKGLKRQAVILTFGVGGAAAANVVLKMIFQRDRPSLWSPLVAERSFSFPSGHAMASSAFALCILLLLWRTKWRWLAAIAGTLFVLLVGLSRMYLGVHYPTDVVAGWTASVAWVLLVSSLVSDAPFALSTRVSHLRSKLRPRKTIKSKQGKNKK